MDLLESFVPIKWWEDFTRQHFSIITEEHASFVSFCKNLIISAKESNATKRPKKHPKDIKTRIPRRKKEDL
eukprot:11825193-Ditylum_brightwellii.AAC.1